MVENVVIYVLLGKSFINEHILAMLPDEQKVTVRKSTPVIIVKERNLPAYAVLRKHNIQGANIKTHLVATDDQRSTI